MAVTSLINEIGLLMESPEKVDSVKSLMSRAELLIKNFKQKQMESYENLLKTEIMLYQEILEFDKKINTLQMQNDDELKIKVVGNRSNVLKPLNATDLDVINTLPVEVANFERFIDCNGGKYGNWNVEDHNTFLRIWTKYFKKYKQDDTNVFCLTDRRHEELTRKMEREVLRLVSSKTVFQIREHHEWYLEYCNLLQRKKDAIQRWRNAKDFQHGGTENHDHGSEILCEGNSPCIVETSVQRKLEGKRAALEAWRVQRELERFQEKENARLCEKQEKLTLLNEMSRKKEELHQKVALYQNNREQQRQATIFCKLMEEKEEEKRRRRSFLECENRIQQRNHDLLSNRIERKRELDMKRHQNQRLPEKPSPHIVAPKDPSRLMKTTEAFNHRIGTPKESPWDMFSVTSIRHISRLGTPNWKTQCLA